MIGAAARWTRVLLGASEPEPGALRPLGVLARVTGAERGFPWPGAACAALLLAAARLLAAPLLAKLMAALLVPLLAGWLVGWLAPRMTPERQDGAQLPAQSQGQLPAQSWALPWAWAIAALALGMAGAATLHRQLSTPQELIAFTRRDLLALAALAWAAALALPLAMQQRQAYRNELAALRLSALGAELKALQAQVEPHFLYNTLANTRYLARHQPERAVEMLDHLIAYLHRALPDMRSRASTVGRECELAHHYLALMAIRFGERMRYTVDVDAELADEEMPPLLLISLVENAVRHGVEPMPGTVTVAVRASPERADPEAKARLCLAVIDDGAGLGRQGPIGNGVGLRNARDRLRALYRDAASLTLTRGPDGRTRAELLLPLPSRRP